MSDAEWAEIHRKVMAAGLLPGRSVRERLLALPSIDDLIEAAKASGKSGMLDEAMLDELLSLTPKTTVVARTIAPVSYTHLRAHETVLDLV